MESRASLKASQRTQLLLLQISQLRVPQVNDQNQPKLTSAVPDLMLKGLVEDEKAALPPLPLLASGR